MRKVLGRLRGNPHVVAAVGISLAALGFSIAAFSIALIALSK